jgi:hypothetical protein
MRPRFIIFLLFVVLAISSLIFYFRPAKRVATSEPALETARTVNQVSAASTKIMNVQTQNVSPISSVFTNQNVPNLQSSAQHPMTSEDERHLKIFRKYNNQYNAPVDFYAQVIDTESNPVPDVKVNVSIYDAFLASPTNTVASNNIVRLQKLSGIDGRFEINGENGYGIDLDSIQKDGFELAPDTHHSYESVSGTIYNPVSIKVRKTH